MKLNNNIISSHQVTIIKNPLVVYTIGLVKAQQASIKKAIVSFVFPFKFMNFLSSKDFFNCFRKTHGFWLGSSVSILVFFNWAWTHCCFHVSYLLSVKMKNVWREMSNCYILGIFFGFLDIYQLLFLYVQTLNREGVLKETPGRALYRY